MTDHPVDSTYHRCCNSIGGHSRHCPDGPAAIFAEAATAPAADHDTTVRASWRGTYHTAACSCGWQAPVSMSEHAARELAATHYLAAGGSSDDDSALARAKQRHPASRTRRHEATITAAGGQLHASCSGCSWTFTGPVGREVVAEAAGHVEAAQVLGVLGVIR